MNVSDFGAFGVPFESQVAEHESGQFASNCDIFNFECVHHSSDYNLLGRKTEPCCTLRSSRGLVLQRKHGVPRGCMSTVQYQEL